MRGHKTHEQTTYTSVHSPTERDVYTRTHTQTKKHAHTHTHTHTHTHKHTHTQTHTQTHTHTLLCRGKVQRRCVQSSALATQESLALCKQCVGSHPHHGAAPLAPEQPVSLMGDLGPFSALFSSTPSCTHQRDVERESRESRERVERESRETDQASNSSKQQVKKHRGQQTKLDQDEIHSPLVK